MDYRYDKIKAYVADGDLTARQAIRTIMFNAGFREITLASTLREITDGLDKEIPDLIITDTHLKDGDFIPQIQRIRQHKIGKNPYITLVALVPQEESASIVTNAMLNGIDDIVVKPVATNTLLSRLTRLIEKRRPYVVNGEYVGPRRVKDKESMEIKVPNILAERAEGLNPSHDDVLQAVKRVNKDIEVKRLELLTDRMVDIMDVIARHAAEPDVMETHRQELVMLMEEANYVRLELADTEYDHVGELCTMVSRMAKRMLEQKEKDASLLRVFVPLSDAIRKGMVLGTKGKSAISEISGIIAA